MNQSWNFFEYNWNLCNISLLNDQLSCFERKKSEFLGDETGFKFMKSAEAKGRLREDEKVLIMFQLA